MVDRSIDVPPARTILFVPANREDRMRKSLTLDTDAVIFDLESAIPRGEATVARSMVRDVLDSHHAPRPRICVRISAVTTDDFAEDLTAAVHPNLTAIVVPQVVSADDIVATDAALGRAEAAAGVRVGSTIIWPMLETANALRTAYEIASSSPRIAYMGGATSRGGDLARSVGYRFTPKKGQRTTLLAVEGMLIDTCARERLQRSAACGATSTTSRVCARSLEAPAIWATRE